MDDVLRVSLGGVENDELVVIMANPRDEFSLKALTMASGQELSVRVGIASEIENGIEKLFGGGRSQMGQIVDSLGEGEEDLEDVEHLRDLASEAPVIRLFVGNDSVESPK